MATPSVNQAILTPTAGSGRLISLDIFRGATIAAMILVNDPGNWNAVYAQLEHSEWNGCTFTDLIFPFFLFIVGISMYMSFESRRGRGATRGGLMKHVVRRAVIIYAIGFFLAAFPSFDLHTVRIMGVLERIALVYLVSGALVLYTGKKTWAAVTAAILVGYWLLMTRTPGFDLTPDGNLAAWLDRKIMYEHLWVAHRWDPEGFLSSVPAIATTMLGVFTGAYWKKGATGEERGSRKLAWMAVFGVIGIIAGYLWGMAFPINKNLWTSSYVLFTAGFALLLLAAIEWLVELTPTLAKAARVGHPGVGHPQQVVPWWGRPWVWYGANAIAVYALSSLAGKASISFYTMWHGQRVMWKTYLYERFFAPLAAPIHASLLWALAYVLTFLVLAWIMYRKAIFIKI
jgi:predicted acyltransferase